MPSRLLVFACALILLPATALADAGDGVLVGDPYYATYAGVIRASGAVLQPVPLRIETGFVMRPEDLERAVTEESRVLLLNTPHNPTGSLLDRATLAALGEIARNHDLWIVCDEVYEDLIFDGDFVSPLEIASLRERTIVTSSISKTFAATGFRSGWAVGPEDFCTRLLPISETILFGNQPFIADMTETALRGSFDTAERMRTSYAARADMIAAELAEHDPENAARYAANAAAAREELEALEAEIAARLAPVQDVPYLVYHDAYQYFEARFGLAAAGALSLSDAADPGPARIAALRDLAQEAGIVCVFSEPQFDGARVASVFGDSVRHDVLDPLGSRHAPGPALYPALIEDMAATLERCLGPDR